MITDKSRDRSVVSKMLMYCDRINIVMERFGRSHETFLNDFMFHDVLSMEIFQIGELCNHFSDDFRNSHPDIPWRDIKGMRNLFAHSFYEMDIEIIWNTALYNIPDIRKFCEDIINQK